MTNIRLLACPYTSMLGDAWIDITSGEGRKRVTLVCWYDVHARYLYPGSIVVKEAQYSDASVTIKFKEAKQCASLSLRPSKKLSIL